ncbi:MAG: MarR family winged helix-turn-helix transcriptional regulator [Solirubrobacterales bacterium]
MQTKESVATTALSRLLGAHATLIRELNAALVAQHALTLNDYGTLLLLSRAGEQGMRRIDLANELQLSPSGITRLLDRLEDQGLVAKGECKEDARVSYAVLTETGLAKLREVAPGHVDDIERRLGAVLDETEMETLTELLGRLSDRDESCTPDE